MVQLHDNRAPAGARCFSDVLTREPLIIDATKGPRLGSYAVMNGVKLGVDVLTYGQLDPVYFGMGRLLFASKGEAFKQAGIVACASLHEITLGSRADQLTMALSDYADLRRFQPGLPSTPPQDILTAAIVADVQPGVDTPGYPFHLRDMLSPHSIDIISTVLGVTLYSSPPPGAQGV
jgi:hypothetical protein